MNTFTCEGRKSCVVLWHIRQITESNEVPYALKSDTEGSSICDELGVGTLLERPDWDAFQNIQMC